MSISLHHNRQTENFILKMAHGAENVNPRTIYLRYRLLAVYGLQTSMLSSLTRLRSITSCSNQFEFGSSKLLGSSQKLMARGSMIKDNFGPALMRNIRAHRQIFSDLYLSLSSQLPCLPISKL